MEKNLPFRSHTAHPRIFSPNASAACKLPQVKKDLTHPGAPLTAYQSMQVLADYTKEMALQHNFTMVKNAWDSWKRCM
ncbi:MAG TPA: hypothetical protein VNS58_09710 [Puia sp.]|nr:hypothetical protein [Puia sp.]